MGDKELLIGRGKDRFYFESGIVAGSIRERER